MAVRVVLHIAAAALLPGLDAATLNAAFIGMAIGNYIGRAITVGRRALALVRWDPAVLPSRAARSW